MNKIGSSPMLKINVFSFFWAIIALKIIIFPDVGIRNIFDYFVWGFSAIGFIVRYCQVRRIERIERNLLFGFGSLLLISIVGILQNITVHSATSTIAVFCIGSFFIINSFFPKDYSNVHFGVLYFVVLLRLVIRTINGEYLGNTSPAVLFFSTLIYSALILDDNSLRSGKGLRNVKKLWNLIMLLVTIALMTYVSWNSRSRTTIFASIIVFVVFFVMHMSRFRESTLCKLFWFFVIGLLIVIIVYINVGTYKWFEKINAYSTLLFQKRLDSQRPEIWRYSVNSLKWWQYIIGGGTGTLPSYSGYESSSFHNTYLQLFMQNGLVGLMFLVVIFKSIWFKLAKHPEDAVCQFVLAGFIGILIYNAFESTLLQNKAFVGITEWMFLSIGIVRSRKIEKEKALSV